MDSEMLPVAAVIAFLLKTTGVLLLTFVAATILRRASAGTRHTLWLTALVLVLALPLLADALPRWRVLPPTSALRIDVAREGARTDPDAARLLPGADAELTVPPSAASGAEAPPTGASIVPDVRDGAASRLDVGAGWATILFGMWAAVTLLLVGRLAASALTLRRTLAAADPLTGGEWTTPLWEACDRLDLGDAPRLLRSERIEMPFACGLLRPTIVLPASADEWTPDRRRAVLFHELAHIRRRDLFGHTLARLTCALYWMHPLVWTAARRLRSESERACDDLVLASGTPASEYADHLLQILVGVRGNDAPAVALPMGRRREFEGRMLAILDPALRRRGSRIAHGGVLAALSLGALALMAMAPMQSTAGAPTASTTDAATSPRPRGEAVSPGGQLPELQWLGNTSQSSSGSGSVEPVPHGIGGAAPHPDPLPHPEPALHSTIRYGDATGSRFEVTVGEWVTGAMSLAFGFGSDQEKNVPLLLRMLANDESAEVRRTAAWALADVGTAEVNTALIRALRQDVDASVREMSAWGLQDAAEGAAVEALGRSLVDDSSPEVRSRAAWGLGRHELASGAGMEALVAALGDGNAEVREMAAWAIGARDPAGAPAPLYLRGLRDAEAEVRLASAWALGQIGDPAGRSALAAAFERESDPEALQAMTRALLVLGPLDDGAIEALLGSTDPEVRERAVRIAAGVGIEFWPWPWPRPEARPTP